MSGLIRWIDDLGGDDIPSAGAKLARLGELRSLGLSVPEGFVVTTEAFRIFADSLDEFVARHLATIDDADDLAKVESVSATIRRAFEATPIPPHVAAQIAEAYEELSDRCRDLNVPTAVRSSAVDEDTDSASFAGQFETYLGVAGVDRVLDAVRRCWAGTFTPRALSYRLRRGIDDAATSMAVGVVELVHARASGVTFTIHPVSGKKDRVVVECSWGWGEAVVQGLVTPDHVEVGKTDRRVLEYRVATKEMVSMFDYARGEVVEGPMPERFRDRRVLDDEEITAVVDAALRIEDHYGYPVDVEWVISRHRRPGDPISVVQARPETTRNEPRQPRPSGPVDVAQLARSFLLGRSGGVVDE